jgi:hypothetical protein
MPRVHSASRPETVGADLYRSPRVYPDATRRGGQWPSEYLLALTTIMTLR